jgi:nitrilase
VHRTGKARLFMFNSVCGKSPVARRRLAFVPTGSNRDAPLQPPPKGSTELHRFVRRSDEVLQPFRQGGHGQPISWYRRAVKAIKVAAAQLAPVHLDRDATVAKAVDAMKEAGRNGAELVVFPEAFVPGYPYWAMALDPMSINPFLQRLQAQALTVPSAALEPLQAAARQAGLVVCMGLTEKDGGTLYNSQLFIGGDGQVIACRRKLVPTSHERMVWGRGDGSDLAVYQTPLGRLGGLICYEHANALFRYALQAQGEEIHLAVWPALASITTVIDAAVRSYAFEAQAFVVCVTSVLTAEILAALGDAGSAHKLQPGGGYSAILTPRGDFLAGPAREGETILYADLDPALIDRAKTVVDSAGHYARPDVVSLHLRGGRQRPLVIE